MNPTKLAQSFLMDIAAGLVVGDEMRARARLLAIELEPVAWPDGPTMEFAELEQRAVDALAGADSDHRTLLDALLEDAEEHEAAGRMIQAANARAAVENLRSIPPWNKPTWTWDCPHCDWPPSHNPNDVANRYCGHCHHYCDGPPEERQCTSNS